jgi:hypothetical protein
MNVPLVVCILVAAPLAALALHDLQAWLEQRDYDRHAED